MKDELTFFDDNPVIDDEPTAHSGTLIVPTLPTDIRNGDPIFVEASMTIARAKDGRLELRRLTRRERLNRWIDKHPRLSDFLEGVYYAGLMLFGTRRR